ncbi:MAG: hypothetical protein KDE51_00315 [Anaerolineales bacterium]|nr:hypothetical protein [Anaerolineales bacterium]
MFYTNKRVGLSESKFFLFMISFLCLLFGLFVIGISTGQARKLDTAVFNPEPADPFPTDPHNHDKNVLPLDISTEVKGAQNWAILMCKFPDVDSTPAGATPTYFKNMFNRTSGEDLDKYWKEVSYNNITAITADAYDWKTLPHNRATYGFGIDDPGYDVDGIIQDCIDVHDTTVNFNGYDAIAVMLNSENPVAIATFSPKTNNDGANFTYGSISIPSDKYRLSLVAHEMGHAYILGHSSANGNIYQNPWDIMGYPSTYRCINPDPTYSCLGWHTIAPNKIDKGWIANEQIFNAPQGTSTITLDGLGEPTINNYLVAKIEVENGADYYIEARTLAGYDAKLAGEAVLIHYYYGGFFANEYSLIDIDGAAPYDDAGAMWTVGETYTDAQNDIEIHVDSKTATGFVITIKNGEDAKVITNLSASNVTPAANEEVTFKTVVSYVDGSSGTTSTMITQTLPAALTFTAASVTIDPPSAGTVNSQNPPVVTLSNLGSSPVMIEFKATVNNGITDPTAISIPVTVQYGDKTDNYTNIIIANGLSVYLPVVLKQ